MPIVPQVWPGSSRPNWSETYDSNTTANIEASCPNSSTPHPCKQAIDLPSGQVCKTAATIKGVVPAIYAWESSNAGETLFDAPP